MIKSFEDMIPKLGKNVYIAETASIIGDVTLEDDDGSEHDVAEHVADQPVRGLQWCELRRVVQPDDQTTADKNLRRVGTPNHLQQLIDQDRDDGDIKQPPQTDPVQRQGVGQRRLVVYVREESSPLGKGAKQETVAGHANSDGDHRDRAGRGRRKEAASY